MFYLAPLALIAMLVASARARCRPAAAGAGRGGARRRRASRGDPVRALHHHERRLRHVRAAALVVGAGSLHPLRRRFASSRLACAVGAAALLRLPAAALLARAARARRRLLRPDDGGRSRTGVTGSIASVGSLWAGIRVTHPDWIDRAVGRNADVDVPLALRPARRSTRSGTTSSSTAASARSTRVDGTVPGRRRCRDAVLARDARRAARRPDRPRRAHARYVLTDADVIGKPVGRDPRIGLALVPRQRAGDRADACRRASTRTRGRGRHVIYTRFQLHRRNAGGAASAPTRTCSARPGGDRVESTGAVVGIVRIAPTAAADAWWCRSDPTPTHVCTVRLHHRGERSVPGAGRRRGGSAPTSLASTTAVRIAFDVSPLSHERTGRQQLHPRLARRARRGRARAQGHEVVAFAPTSPAGRRVIPEALARHRRRAAARHAARRARLAHGLVAARASPPAERWLGPLRRAALHRLDVPAAARRRARDDDPRPRAAAPSRVDDEAHAGDARPQVPQRRAHLRRDLRQLGVHRRRLRRDARLPARADRRRASRHRRGVHGRTARRPTSAGRTCSPSRRSSRARTSARSSRRSRCSATRGSSLVVAGGAGLGRAAAARPARRRPARPRRATRSSRGSTAAPRRSSTRRASRASGCRSPRRWPRARRSSPPRTRRSTRPAATPRCAPTRRAPRRSRRRSARRSPAATSCAPRGLAHARAFSWRRVGELFLEGYERFA